MAGRGPAGVRMIDHNWVHKPAAAMAVEVEDPLYVRKILAAATSKNVPSMAPLVMREA
jgi:hypothetical protein